MTLDQELTATKRRKNRGWKSMNQESAVSGRKIKESNKIGFLKKKLFLGLSLKITVFRTR